MWWRCSRPATSSMVQNQKLRCITSRRVSSMPSHVPKMAWYRPTWSSRSSRPATQPMPPSERQSFRSGKRTGILEYSQSTAANIAQPKNSTPMVSDGAPLDVAGADDDEPTCRQTTVSVSAHAARNGSQ